MKTFPWKTAIAGAALIAGTIYVFAAQLTPGPHGGMNGGMGMHGQMPQGGMNGDMARMHQQMMQGQGGMHGGMGQGMQGGMHGGHGMMQQGSARPTMPGQDAFGTIQEIVQILEADPTTDWAKVDIAGLREHLIDMNEVALHAVAASRITNTGVEIAVTGEGRTLAAIKRMVPEHVKELARNSWKASTEDLPNGVKIAVTATDALPLARLKALGFMGIMVQGGHHQPHHLMMAKGEPLH